MITRQARIHRADISTVPHDAIPPDGWTCCGYEGMYAPFSYEAECTMKYTIFECRLCNSTSAFGLTRHELEVLADHPKSAYALISDIELLMVNPYNWIRRHWPETNSGREGWLRSIETRNHIITALDAYMPEQYSSNARADAIHGLAETIRWQYIDSVSDDDYDAIVEFCQEADPLEIDTALEDTKSRRSIALNPHACDCERCEQTKHLIEDCRCYTCLAETGRFNWNTCTLTARVYEDQRELVAA